MYLLSHIYDISSQVSIKTFVTKLYFGCCIYSSSAADMYKPFVSKYCTRRFKKGLCETVSESQMRAQCRLALVTATFILLLSARKPTVPSWFDLTIAITIASFSLPEQQVIFQIEDRPLYTYQVEWRHLKKGEYSKAFLRILSNLSKNSCKYKWIVKNL